MSPRSPTASTRLRPRDAFLPPAAPAPTDGGSDALLLWQLADSAFPTGSFGHSGGLEAAVQMGAVPGPSELEAYLHAALVQCGHSSLLLAIAAHTDPDRLPDLDALADAFLINHVANRASRLQGQTFRAAAERCLGVSLPETPWNHQAPVFGGATRRLHLPLETAARLYLFLQLRCWISAAIRLGIIGPLHAQTLQHDFAPTLEQVLAASLQRSIDDLTQTSPLLELWQGTHDRLYSRLFQS